MYMISRKNFLAKNLDKMHKVHPNLYDFYPKTWTLPADYAQLKKAYITSKVYIAKPEASSQGKGIFLTKNIDEFTPTDKYVVQEYIRDPLLLDGFKFDIRLYVLLTGCSPLRAYVHK